MGLFSKQFIMPTKKTTKKVAKKVAKVEEPVVTSLKKPKNAQDWANRQK